MKLRSGIISSPLGARNAMSAAHMQNGDGDHSPTMKDLTASGSTHQVRRFYFPSINMSTAATHFVVFLYATCFYIQGATLPYLTKKLGVNAIVFGYLETTFAAVQLIGGPMFGRFGDTYGGRAAFMLAFASAALSYGILSLAYSVPIVFLSRLPQIFMHAMQAGQMVVTDLSSPKDRADALGKISVAYSIGVIVGPNIGGIVTKHTGEQMAAFVACIVCVLALFISRWFIPEHTKTQESSTAEDSKPFFNFSQWGEILKQPNVVKLLLVKMALGLPLGAFHTMLGIVAMDIFKLDAVQNGYITSFMGLVVVLIQGFGIGLLTKRYTEKFLIKCSTFLLIWSWLLMAFVTNVWQFLIVMIPKAFALAVQGSVVSSILTQSVSEADTGATLGLNMAVHSVIRIVAPTIGGYMLTELGFQAFGYFGFIITTFVMIFLWTKLKE